MVHLVGVVIWSGWSGDLGVPGGLCCQCGQGGQGCPVGQGGPGHQGDPGGQGVSGGPGAGSDG